MTATYEPTGTPQTVSGVSTSTITFSSISQAYTDLVLVINAETSANVDIFVRFNSNTASNYSYTVLQGNGSTAVSSRVSNATSLGLVTGNPSGRFCSYITNIFNYTNATTFKTTITRVNTSDRVGIIAGLWRATPAAITELQVRIDSGYFVAGSTFALYGIKAE
jgi:hypothetical protein